MGSQKCFCTLTGWPVALLCSLVLLWATQAAGQGYKVPDNIKLAASNTQTILQRQYSGSRKWQRSYKNNPAAACSRAGSKSLCAAANQKGPDVFVQLMLATSPASYSSLDSRYTGGHQLVAAPQDQQDCGTCTSFAVASVAETAMASALGVDVSQCSISVQALHFCPPSEQASRSCSGSWTLASTLGILQRSLSPTIQLPTSNCLPYQPDITDIKGRRQLCSGKCTTPNRYASKGVFETKQITTLWQAQRQIRQYGSVVTSFEILSDFREFYNNPANAKAVYKPKPGAKLSENHAVVLVGYDNDQQYWLAKNSWGSSWADGGYFRVAYDTCSILTGAGEMYGLTWQPVDPNCKDCRLQLPLLPGPSAGCYWYQARDSDYMSKVALLAEVPLDKFMLDNVPYVTDLDGSLQGKQLLVCNPAPGSYKLSGSPSTTTPGGGPTDPQMEALLRIKAAIDTTNHLKEWTRERGRNGGYCRNWRGLVCFEKVVTGINLHFETIGSGLCGTLPPAAAFAGLPRLTVRLWIFSQPGLTGTIPADWSKLVQVEDIKLFNNSLTGPLPAAWSSLTRLSALELGINRLTGPLPAAWSSLTRLSGLVLGGNQLTGPLPAAWSSLTRLSVLMLDFNQLTGPLPAAWSSLTRLSVLVLRNNKLTGKLPDSFRELSVLGNMVIGANQLTGSIPAAWSSLTGLKVLLLYDNQLTGQLPDSFKKLKAIEEVALYNNQLTGTIPATWSSMTRLKLLLISRNKLTGPLPTTFSNLKALQWLDVSKNAALTGTIPASWASMTAMRAVWLLENPQLGGCLPATWKSTLTNYYINNTKVSGFC